MIADELITAALEHLNEAAIKAAMPADLFEKNRLLARKLEGYLREFAEQKIKIVLEKKPKDDFFIREIQEVINECRNELDWSGGSEQRQPMIDRINFLNALKNELSANGENIHEIRARLVRWPYTIWRAAITKEWPEMAERIQQRMQGNDR